MAGQFIVEFPNIRLKIGLSVFGLFHADGQDY
jgi:hypothetical protein